MDDSAAHRLAPAAAPEAPDWFRWALSVAPEREFHEVAGARIETLTWGERGKPGLLFLHGNGAHADWWSFIAPFFAENYRVAALSWSGMGGSDRRERYALDLFVEEAVAVAERAGLFEGAAKPAFIGHSFGSFPLIAAAVSHGERLRLGIAIDPPAFVAERRSERKRPTGDIRPNRIYPTLEAALERFRLEPAQPSEHPFIVDHIARTSVTRVATPDGAGWSWRFDPFLWQGYRSDDPLPMLARARCSLAMIVGTKSALFRPGDFVRLRELLPAGSPFIEIPEAHHHVMIDQPIALVATLRALLALEG
jgi:pimeloyl-ACP methyl ester carboxylesterase